MNWRSVSLGKLCTLRAGNTFKPKYQGRATGDYPFIKVKDMNSPGNAISITEAENWVTLDECREFRGKPFPPGTSVFAKIGEALRQNRVRFIVRDTLIDNNMMGAMANPEVADERFLYYLLSNFDIASNASGTALPYLTVKVLSTVRFQIPDLSTQRRMAEILSAYDDLIENNRQRIRLLEQAARLLYREWFVHLRFPGREKVKVTDGVPEGWERKTIGNITKLKYGRSLKKGDRVPGAHPVYGSSGVVGTHEKALVTGPGIILGRKGNIGSVFWSEGDFYPIDTVYYIDRRHCTMYLYWTLLNTQFINTDVAVPGLNRDFAHSRKLLIPHTAVLTIFERHATAIQRQIDQLEKYNASLQRMRRLLLPRFMSDAIVFANI